MHSNLEEHFFPFGSTFTQRPFEQYCPNLHNLYLTCSKRNEESTCMNKYMFDTYHHNLDGRLHK